MKKYYDDENDFGFEEYETYELETVDNETEKKAKKPFRNMMKKSVMFGLCAILAGGIAFGGYGAISSAGTQKVLAANADEAKLTFASQTTVVDSESETRAVGSLDVSDIVEEAMPSIVSITTKSVQEVQSYYGLFGGYGGYAPSYEQEVEGSGSGIIVGKNDTELLIATNYHVVEDANTISVAFVDNEAYEGKVKGYDSSKDLAVVAVLLDDLSDDTISQINVAKIGSSDDLKVGEQVVAIGNALGYGQSVTTGIVSAKNRVMDSESGEMSTADDSNGVNLIQTDAAINPGNSGGALLNMNGELVGINSAKLAATEVEGMGYAIAITDVSDILENLMNAVTRDQLEDEEHGVLGIMGSTVSSEVIQGYGFPAGVYVAEVTEGGAAEAAGLPAKCIITEFDGKSVTSIEQLINYLTYYAPGEQVPVTYSVMNGGEYEEKTIQITLGEQQKSEDTAGELKSDSEQSYEEFEGFGSQDSQNDQRSREDFFSEWGDGLFGDRN